MERLIACAAALLLLGAADATPVERSPAAQAKMDKWLEGKVVKETRRCLKSANTNNPIAIDDHTMLFKDGPRVWRNELRSSFQCDNLGARKALVSRGPGMQLCSGERVFIVDLTDGQTVGSCELGEFTRYEKP